tara:strand:+ start:49 stop:1038 length:990 start_codon:yes stop_codon:yes gene_type:complete
MKAKQPRFTNGVIGNEIIGDPPRDTRGSPQTKSFGYQVLGFGSGGSTPPPIGVEYLIVGGGGSGGNNRFHGGGGGAGGFRTNVGESLVYTSGIVYTVTVGEGGTTPVPGGDGMNNSGNLSSIADDQGNDPIASAGGGRGGLDTIQGSQQTPGQLGGGGDGGSGGGTSINTSTAWGLGNVPSTDPSQGNNGNKHNSPYRNGGGGGAGQAGVYPGGAGGAGTSNSITGSAVTYAGGGGGGQYPSGGGGAGGAGGGGAGSSGDGGDGTDGLGGGGGGAERAGSGGGGDGGDGVVILRMLTSDYSGTTSGSPTITTDGGDTIIKYLADGTYTS